METCCYFYLSNKGEVLITPNEEKPSWWDLYVGGQLLRPAYYSSPEEAAARANERDFGDAEINKDYVGLRVPADLDRWRKRKLVRANR